MRSLKVLFLAVILGKTHHVSSSHHKPAFVTCVRSSTLNGIKVSSSKASDEKLLDAQEAAAVDAHDISDPGIEGASMERAVMMAAELFETQIAKEEHHKSKSSSLFGSIWNFFRPDNEYEIRVVKEAEANYAHDLSDVAAIEHANEIAIEDSSVDEEAKSSLFNSIKEFFHLFHKRKEEEENELNELRDAEAEFAHTLSDVAAMEHANEI